MTPATSCRRAAVIAAVSLFAAGCSSFVAPNSARAPLKASLAAEALWAGPLSAQAATLPTIGPPCERPAGTAQGPPRMAEDKRGVRIGAVTVLTPPKIGEKLRAPWIRWTHLYEVWDRAATPQTPADVFTDDEKKVFWNGDVDRTFTPVIEAFTKLNARVCGMALTDHIMLQRDFEQKLRSVLIGRIKALVEKRVAAEGKDREALEQQIRSHLELLAASSQRATERVKKIDALARQEAELYITLAESARTLAALQRNVTNHLLGVDLVLSADEAKAIAEATRDKLGRIRDAIDAGRQSELEAQKTATTPEWLETVGKALDTVRPGRKE